MARALLIAGAALALAACATANRPAANAAPAAAPACAFSAEDRAWVDRTVEAWRFTSREITGIAAIPHFQAVFFDADCVLASSNALNSANAAEVTWTATPHGEMVTMPDGSEIPTGVTSFTSGENGLIYFGMSTPSIWRAGGVDGGPIPLETMMVAVMLHEGSHVAQTGPYGPRLGALITANSLPDSFNDDSLQRHFQANTEFAASIARETELFAQAAAAPSDAEARRLAREARSMMRARAARWYVGEDAYWGEAENIWLTFEGAGQWAGYQWLTSPRGAAVPVDAVNARFVHGRWWSQTEGFALVMALDRIAGPSWKRHAFGDGAQDVVEMLDAALAQD